MKSRSVVEHWFVTVETEGQSSTFNCLNYGDMIRQFERQFGIVTEVPVEPYCVEGGVIRHSNFGTSCEIMHKRSYLFG